MIIQSLKKIHAWAQMQVPLWGDEYNIYSNTPIESMVKTRDTSNNNSQI